MTFTCSPEQIEAEIGHVTANVGSILAQLRAAAPKAKIIFVSQYNPYPTVLKPEGTGDATVEALNGALKGVAASYGVGFANTARVINFSGTHGGPEAGDIPTVCAFTAMCPGGVFNPPARKPTSTRPKPAMPRWLGSSGSPTCPTEAFKQGSVGIAPRSAGQAWRSAVR